MNNGNVTRAAIGVAQGTFDANFNANESLAVLCILRGGIGGQWGRGRQGQAGAGERGQGQAGRRGRQAGQGQRKSPRRLTGGRDRGSDLAFHNLEGVESVFPFRDGGDGADGVDRRDLGGAIICFEEDAFSREAQSLGGDLRRLGGGCGGGGGGPLRFEEGSEFGERGGGYGLGLHAVAFGSDNREPPGGGRRDSGDKETMGDSPLVVKSQLKRKRPGVPPGLAFHSSASVAAIKTSNATRRAAAIMPPRRRSGERPPLPPGHRPPSDPSPRGR